MNKVIAKKNNKGVISIFAFFSMMFFLIFIMVAYNNVMEKGKLQVETEEVLVDYYKATQTAKEISIAKSKENIELSKLRNAEQKLETMKSNSNNKYIYSNGYCYKIDNNKEYQRVEYIQSSGTQYIDTGLTGYMNYKYELTFQQLNSNNCRVWGVLLHSWVSGPNMTITWNVNRAVRWEYQEDYLRLVDNMDTVNTDKHTIIINNGEVLYDNVNKGTSPGHNSNFVVDGNIYLFTANQIGFEPFYNMSGRIFEYKVWNNEGIMIQNFIPCYKISNNEIGFYDIINDVFYVNAGSGTFTKGPEI